MIATMQCRIHANRARKGDDQPHKGNSDGSQVKKERANSDCLYRQDRRVGMEYMGHGRKETANIRLKERRGSLRKAESAKHVKNCQEKFVRAIGQH